MKLDKIQASKILNDGTQKSQVYKNWLNAWLEVEPLSVEKIEFSSIAERNEIFKRFGDLKEINDDLALNNNIKNLGIIQNDEFTVEYTCTGAFSNDYMLIYNTKEWKKYKNDMPLHFNFYL